MIITLSNHLDPLVTYPLALILFDSIPQAAINTVPLLINKKRSLECVLSSSASWCLSNTLVLQEVVFL